MGLLTAREHMAEQLANPVIMPRQQQQGLLGNSGIKPKEQKFDASKLRGLPPEVEESPHPQAPPTTDTDTASGDGATLVETMPEASGPTGVTGQAGADPLPTKDEFMRDASIESDAGELLVSIGNMNPIAITKNLIEIAAAYLGYDLSTADDKMMREIAYTALVAEHEAGVTNGDSSGMTFENTETIGDTKNTTPNPSQPMDDGYDQDTPYTNPYTIDRTAWGANSGGQSGGASRGVTDSSGNSVKDSYGNDIGLDSGDSEGLGYKQSRVADVYEQPASSQGKKLRSLKKATYRQFESIYGGA